MTVATRKHKQIDPDQENVDPKRPRTSASTTEGHVITHASSPAISDTSTATLEGSTHAADPQVAATVASAAMSSNTHPDEGVTTVLAASTDAIAPAVDTSVAVPPALPAPAVPTTSAVSPGTPVTVTDISLRPGELEYMMPDFLTRLIPILNFADNRANRFSIGLLPLASEWGPTGDGSGLDRYLCRNGRPITVWMTGVVTSVWFSPTEGSRVNIGVRLLTDRDQEVSRRMLFGRSQPEGDASNAGVTTYASHFLSDRGDAASTSFEDVYDATESLESWSTMNKDSPESIHKTDIVLVESYIKRYKPPREQGIRQGWTRWGVNYELLRVARLLGGPGPADLVPEESTLKL